MPATMAEAQSAKNRHPVPPQTRRPGLDAALAPRQFEVGLYN